MPPPCPQQIWLQNQCSKMRRKNGEATAPTQRRLCQVRMTTGTCKMATCTTAVQLGMCSPPPAMGWELSQHFQAKLPHSPCDC